MSLSSDVKISWLIKINFLNDKLIFLIKYSINYCKWYIMFWILTFHIMYAIISDIRNNDVFNSYADFLFLVVLIEWSWLCYLVKAQPYRSFSENRILIVNQIVVVILGIWSSIFWIIVLITYDFDNDFLDNIDWISWMWVLPISYTLFCFHYIFIKTCYKKKKNLIYPRFWKLKNPNRHYARDDSFTEYMAYNPYGEY